MNTSTSKKDFPITIADKVYLLRYNYNALTAVEDMTGKPFFATLTGLQQGNLTNLKQLFYAGLKKNHPEITLEGTGEILDESEGLGQLLSTVSDALNNYFQKNDKAQPVEEGKKKKDSRLTTVA